MPILAIEEFKSYCRPGAKLLALDISKNAIGIAFGDVTSRIVTPLTTIRRKKLRDDAAQLKVIIGQYGPKGLVIGWPLNMDGTKGTRCQAVKDTVMEIEKHLDPILMTYWDERLSTAQARTMVEGFEDNYGKNKGKPVDSYAALIILQTFLDQVT